jgi:hypothetical protein
MKAAKKEKKASRGSSPKPAAEADAAANGP